MKPHVPLYMDYCRTCDKVMVSDKTTPDWSALEICFDRAHDLVRLWSLVQFKQHYPKVKL
jgi:hypothetical protein